MEFHNIFDCARGESKIRDNSTLVGPNLQTKAFGEETRNETTKNRTQHDQGSLNKRSACSMYFWLLHWLLIKGASGNYFLGHASKKLSKSNAWRSRTLGIQLLLQQFKFLIVFIYDLIRLNKKRMIICDLSDNRLSHATAMLS